MLIRKPESVSNRAAAQVVLHAGALKYAVFLFKEDTGCKNHDVYAYFIL